MSEFETYDYVNCQFHPHQLANSRLVLDMERSPLKGGILANDLGLGKTLIYLLAVWMDANEQHRRYNDGGHDAEYWPTQVVIPSHIEVLIQPLSQGSIFCIVRFVPFFPSTLCSREHQVD